MNYDHELLLKASYEVTAKLERLKEAILYSKEDDHFEFHFDCCLEAIQCRKVMRMMASALEANRNLVQLNKEKLQKSLVFLEGLQYYKATINQKILSYDMEVQNVDQYLEKPLGTINWEEGYESVQSQMHQEFQKIKHKNKSYDEVVERKKALHSQIESKKKQHTQIIPNQAKKLKESLLETAKIMNIQELQQLKKISNSQLCRVYDTLQSLMKKQDIMVTYQNEEYEYLELVLKKCGYGLYEKARQCKINIEEKDIKIIIGCISPLYKDLVIGVDRRCDFPNLEVFNRFINNETVKNVFEHPENEKERNINNKFVGVEWVEPILSSSTDASSFFVILRERIFSLHLTRYLTENMKKLPFFQFVGEPNVTNVKKLNIIEFNKINFKEYLARVNVPATIDKYCTKYHFLKKNSVNHPQSQENLVKMRDIQQYFQTQNLEEFIFHNFNHYFVLKLGYYNVSLMAILIVPYQYPIIPSKIKILELCLKGEKQISPLANIKCKFEDPEQKNSLNSKIGFLERQINDTIDNYLKQKQKKSLKVLYQVNRLFTLIGTLINKTGDDKKT